MKEKENILAMLAVKHCTTAAKNASDPTIVREQKQLIVQYDF